MKTVNLANAKKLARRKLKKGQTGKMYQKDRKCSVYYLKDNYNNAYCSYDAPNLIELKKIAGHLRLSSWLYTTEDVNLYAEKLIKLLSIYKLNLDNIKI